MAEQLEFYFPKTKSKHMAIPTTGKVYPSKGGTVRYGVQASMNGSMSLPKYVKENKFYDYGFGVDSVVRKYPQEFIDVFYDFDSYPTADTQDDETVELAYQVWYQKQAENEVLNAEVSVGEKQVKSRKDYDIDNELSGFSNMEVGDIDLEDYEDEITESVEDEVIEAIRESVDDNMPISDGDSVSSHVNVDTELEITVPISGDIEYDWTANETHEEEVDEDEWNAESLDFHGENYQNHLKVIKKAPYGGIGSLLGIGGDTEIGGFSTGELTGSSAIHGDFDSASLNYSGHQNLQVRAETFWAFSIDEDDEGKIHIENKCDGCGKEFLFTQNSNIVGGNRAGAIVYENLDWKDEYGETGYDYPEYSPYGDLLCKSCWKINREEDENADSRGQGQYGAEMEDSPSPSSPLEEVPATVPSPAEPTNESFSADNKGWAYHVYVSDLEEYEYEVEMPLIDLSKQQIVYLGRPTKESAIEAANDVSRDEKYKNYDVIYVVGEHEDGGEEILYRIQNGEISYSAESFNAESKDDDLTKVKKYTNRIMEQDPHVMAEFGPFGYYKLLEHPTAGDTSPLLFYTPVMGGLLMRTTFFDTYELNDELAEKLSKEMVKQIKQNTYFDEDWERHLFNAEMDELSEDTSIIRNQVGDMVGMVELDENDEDIEKVDIDIIDDDGEMAYEGTLGAETFESQGTNTKMILGITALAVGLGLWKGKEIMSISEKISQSIKNMKK